MQNEAESSPLLREMLDQTDLVGAKSPIFDLFFARSASAVTRSEKIQLSLYEVHYALSIEPKMNIVRCP